MSGFVLAGAELVLGDELRTVASGHVHVREGRIVTAGEGVGPAGIPRVDLTGRLLIPGLVNGHTHLADAAVKEVAFGADRAANLFFPPDGLRHRALAALDHSTRLAAMRAAARQMVASGVVAFADFTAGGVAGVEEFREAIQGLPIRGISLGGFRAAPQSGEVLDCNADGLDPALLDEVEAILELADGFAPVRAGDLTDRAMSEIRESARGAGGLLATHAAALPSYREVSLRRTGHGDVHRIVEHLRPDFLVHLTDAHDDELALIAEHDIGIVMCPRANTGLGTPLPPYARALSLGAVVGLGTDNLMLGSPDVLAELGFLGLMLRSSAGDPAAVDARALLRSATIDGARVLGLEDELGSIAPGKAASLVVVDLRRDSLAHSTNPLASLIQRGTAADIEAVVVDGIVVHGTLPQAV